MEDWPPPPPPCPNRTLPPSGINHPDDLNNYKSALCKFMSYKNKICYIKVWEFLVEELSPITPETICRYFCHRAYGRENATPIKNPTGAKLGTLLGWKKKISFFVINCLPTWDEIHHTGNPTKSVVINRGCQTNCQDHDHYKMYFTFPLYLGKLVLQIYLRADIIIFAPKFVIIAIMSKSLTTLITHP